MGKIFEIPATRVLLIYAFLDLMFVGFGMGVPIFCIFFGLPVGWYIARRMLARSMQLQKLLSQLLLFAALTSAFTLLMMAILWGPALGMLFDPEADLANFGIPMILYEPLPSFIGWLILMIIISPVLQFLVTSFAAQLTLLRSISHAESFSNDTGSSNHA